MIDQNHHKYLVMATNLATWGWKVILITICIHIMLKVHAREPCKALISCSDWHIWPAIAQSVMDITASHVKAFTYID